MLIQLWEQRMAVSMARRVQNDGWQMTVEFAWFDSAEAREQAYSAWCSSVVEALTNAMPPLAPEGQDGSRRNGSRGKGRNRQANVGQRKNQEF